MNLSTVSLHLHNLTKLHPLTREQERHADRDQLVNANLRFVITVAKTFQGQGLDLDDLIGAGNLGLVEAARRFQPTRGHKFISYAVWWIRQSIRLALHQHRAAITAPAYRDNLAGKLGRRKRIVEQQQGRTVRDEIVLESLTDDDPQEVRQQLSTCTVLSLDTPVPTSDSADTYLGMTTALSIDPDVERELEESDARRQVRHLLHLLTEQERDILIRRYGINSKEPQTLSEISKGYGLTRERIRQLQNRALEKIRRALARRRPAVSVQDIFS